MAELTTVARPYAEAVFRLAKDTNSVPAWSDALALMAAVAQDPQALAFAANPKFETRQVQALIADILGAKATPEVGNFVATVLENRRFALLPTIAEMYALLRAADESAVEAHIESAFALSDIEVGELTTALTTRFKRKVTAKVSIAPELIGGVRMTIGDDVIDASVRGKLASLSASLTS